MVICSNCGAENKSGFFCGKCGVRLFDDRISDEPDIWNKKEKVSDDDEFEEFKRLDEDDESELLDSDFWDFVKRDKTEDIFLLDDEEFEENDIDEFLDIKSKLKEVKEDREDEEESFEIYESQSDIDIKPEKTTAPETEEEIKDNGLTKDAPYPITDSKMRDKITQINTLLHQKYQDKTSLSISKRGDEYEVALKTSKGSDEASELCDFIKISPGSRKDLINQINEVVTVLNVFSCTRIKSDGRVEWEEDRIEEFDKVRGIEKIGSVVSNAGVLDDKISELSSFGKLLYGMFLPVPIQKHLATVNEPLILKTNDNEVPWELMHDDKDFLCLKMPIGRKLRSREIPRVNPQSKGDKVKILFIANATGDLDAAEEEVRYIQSKLDPDVEVDLLQRHGATSASILSALMSGKYDIIHYAGHAEFDVASPDESALISYNKNKIYAQQIKRILAGKPFVFLNACSSGKEKLCEDGKNYTGSDTEGLASSFILGGAMAFIGASWPMPDISAGILASEFYNQFLKGETIGEAMLKARLHLKEVRPKDINWMAFTLYGDPTIRFSRGTGS
jgi:hypothetical protein